MRIALSIFLAAIYAGQGAWIPYVGLWLAAQGMSEAALPLLFSVMLFSKVFSSPVVAHLCDTSGRPELVGAILSLGLALCYAALLLPGLPGAGIAALVIAASAIAPVLFPIADRLILRVSGHGGQGFGRHRLWGSVGFAVGTLAAGQLAMQASLDLVVILVACLALTSFVVLAVLHFGTALAVMHGTGDKRSPFLVLLGIRPIWPALIASALILASNAHFFTLAPLDWSAAGMTLRTISLIWAVGIAAEVLGFLFGGPILRRFTPGSLLVAAGLLSALRWLAMALWSNAAILLIAQLGQIATIAFTAVAFAASVSIHVPQNAQVSAFAMFTLLAMGPFISAATIVASATTEIFAVSGFAAMVPICLAATAIAAIGLTDKGDGAAAQAETLNGEGR
ncbi:MAG: MFS transporter [Rhodobacter sp.]|nr:MFS transporter [Rhodobacter sp.]